MNKVSRFSNTNINLIFLLFSWPAIIFLGPFLTFVENNISQTQLSISFLFYIYAVLVLVSIAICLFVLIFIRLIKNKTEINAIFLSVPLSILLILSLSHWFDSSSIVGEDIKSRFIFYVLEFLVIFLVVRKISLLPKVRMVFFVFFVVGALVPIVSILFYLPSLFESNKNIEIRSSFFGDKISEETQNIYYIILDGQSSFDGLSSLYGFKDLGFGGLEKDFLDLKFLNIKPARSSYNNTHLTLRSIFDMEYFATENTNKYDSRYSMYPAMMDKPNQLTELLGENGFSLVWVGNYWAPCDENEWIKCEGEIPSYIYTQQVFYEFIPALNDFKKIKNQLIGKLNLDNDIAPKTPAISTFLETFKHRSSKPRFTFIHELSPHLPYIYNPDCTIMKEGRDTGELSEVEIVQSNYLKTSFCALRSALAASKKIASLDPDAIIVIQADHGSSVPLAKNQGSAYVNTLREDVNLENDVVALRMGIVNLIRVPEYCNKFTDLALDNVQSIRLAVSCGFGFEPILGKARSFWGFYEENPSFGSVVELNFSSY